MRIRRLPKNRCAAAAFALLLLPLLARPARGQAEAPAARFTATASTEYVSVPVVVRDRKGGFVRDLGRGDFRLWVEGKPVAIENFEKSDRAAVSFAILLDVSGSMKIADKLEHAKDAIRHLIRLRRPGDEFCLLTFSEEEIRIVAEFSTDPGPLLRQLFFLQPLGKTALFDAVAETAATLGGKNAKKAILLFTDGVDNASQLKEEELRRVMENESVPVYAIGMKNSSFDVLSEQQRKELSVSALDLVARASGGRMFLVSGDTDLRPISEAIDGELRRVYLLGFEPGGGDDIRYRPILVTVRGGGTRVIRARQGYRGTAARELPGSEVAPRQKGRKEHS